MGSTLKNDEREGLPSASGIEQISLCPGSYNYQKLFPNKGSSDASEGTLRHDLIEQVIKGDMLAEDIDDEQQYECVIRALDLLNKIEAELDVGEHVDQWLEERVWVADNDEKLYSAKYDLLRKYKNGVFLLVDWKTLFGSHTPAQHNIQLLAQALAVYQSTPEKINKIFCALAEPFPAPSYSLVEYSEQRLEDAFDYIKRIINEAKSKDAKRIAGLKQCKFCDALAVCPESRTVITEAMKLKAEGMSPELLSMVMNIASLAEKWASSIKESTKALLAEGEEVKGWKLRGSGSTKSISDADACAKVLMETNQLSWTDFLSANRTSWTGIVKVWKEKRKVDRKTAVSELEEILKDIVQERPKSASLIKEK